MSRLLVFGDLHCDRRHLRGLVERAVAEHCDALVSLGDLTAPVEAGVDASPTGCLTVVPSGRLTKTDEALAFRRTRERSRATPYGLSDSLHPLWLGLRQPLGYAASG